MLSIIKRIQNTTLRTSLRFKIFIIIKLLLSVLIFTTGASNPFCNPDDLSTCSFGGSCKRPKPTVGSQFPNSAYICSCPTIDCSKFGYQPECGSDKK